MKGFVYKESVAYIWSNTKRGIARLFKVWLVRFGIVFRIFYWEIEMNGDVDSCLFNKKAVRFDDW